MSPQNDSGQQWKERFLLTLLQQRNYSERTLKAYGRDVERFIEFFGRNPAYANAQDILRFMAHLKRQAWATVAFHATFRQYAASTIFC